MAQSCPSARRRREPAPDWEAQRAVYQRELDEARVRATQMEKTMRWWSDCTANWREKWAQVRNERNKAREEARQLKAKLDAVSKDYNTVAAEKQELEGQLRALRGDPSEVELRLRTSPPEPAARASLDSRRLPDSALTSKLIDMRLRLDDTTRTLQTEQTQKATMSAKIESLTSELQSAKLELRGDRTIGSSESSHSQVERLQQELQDEAAAKQALEETITELKLEVDRLKSENTVQWSKRELLETENIAILRENKKLYGHVCELKEEVHRLNRISDNLTFEKNRISVKSPRSHGSSSNGSSSEARSLERHNGLEAEGSNHV